jgi:hypothetical protein
METTNQKELFSFAVKKCCNYTPVGPFEKRHYCYCEPRQTNQECLLFHGIPCKWFRDAVLPLKPELQPEWEAFVAEYRSEQALPAPEEQPAGLKTCPCGKPFKPRSNRQCHCSTCARNQRKKKVRENVRRWRKSKTGSV